MKKQFLIILFAFSILLVSCLSWIMEKPSFVLRQITIKPSSFTEMNIFFSVDIQNPNRFDLTFKSFEYTIYLNNKKIGKGCLEKEFLIPSSSIIRVEMPVLAKLKDWSGNLKTFITGNDLPYKIEGKTDIKIAFIYHKFPFSKEGHINLKNLLTL